MIVNYNNQYYELIVEQYAHKNIKMVGIILKQEDIKIKVNLDIPPLDDDWVIIDVWNYEDIENELLNRGVILERVTTLYLADRQYPVYEINKSLIDKKRDKTQKCFISHK